MLSIDTREITTRDLLAVVHDRLTLSHYSLVRMFQKGVMANRGSTSFALAFGAAPHIKLLRRAVRRSVGRFAPLELIVMPHDRPNVLLPGGAIYGLSRITLRGLCLRNKIKVWAEHSKDTHLLVMEYQGDLTVYPFPKGFDDEYVFDSQLYHDAFSKAYQCPVLFRYVPHGLIETLKLRAYQKALNGASHG